MRKTIVAYTNMTGNALPSFVYKDVPMSGVCCVSFVQCKKNSVKEDIVSKEDDMKFRLKELQHHELMVETVRE